MLGSWSQEGYEHEASKSVRGDKFCGLLLDAVNQEELTEERVATWVAQLHEEGLLEGGTPVVNNGAAQAAPAPAPVVQLEERELEMNSALLDQNIESHSSGSYSPHLNPVTGKTMWTSSDGRKSYVTAAVPATKYRP
jgi:hypothetical protein